MPLLSKASNVVQNVFFLYVSTVSSGFFLLHVLLRGKLNLEREQRSERMQECKTEKTTRGEQDRHARSGRAAQMWQ